MARNLENVLNIARVSADRIRHELFGHPRYDSQENAIVNHIMNYMAEEFLKSGVSVVFDTNAMRVGQRRHLRELAKINNADYILVWLQIDPDAAFIRTQHRDRRTKDDRYSEQQTRSTFDKQLAQMQNPQDEQYIVISGKHAFISQKSAIINRLYQMGLISSSSVQGNVAAPGLVNLVPNPQAGRVDFSRRNINVL